jgi:putative oxidoreductase
MKIATIIVRVLLGLLFAVFGLDAFLHFMPMPPLPKGEAGAFMGALFSSGYFHAIKCFEIAGGLLLLIGKKVPLGLTLLGPVIVNILFYDIFLDHTGLPMGIVIAALALFLLWVYRGAFAGLLSQ